MEDVKIIDPRTLIIKKGMKEMEKVEYKRSSMDEVVAFGGKTYCVKAPWKYEKGGAVFLTKAVEEGVVSVDGRFPAVELEAFKRKDGTWDIVAVWGAEDFEEIGVEYAPLFWSEENGLETGYWRSQCCLAA